MTAIASIASNFHEYTNNSMVKNCKTLIYTALKKIRFESLKQPEDKAFTVKAEGTDKDIMFYEEIPLKKLNTGRPRIIGLLLP